MEVSRDHETLSPYALDPAERARIARLVTGAQANDAAQERELRDAIYAVVERAKQRQTPPEQVLAQVKAAAKEGMRAIDPDADALIKRVVGWCIRGYYGVVQDARPRPGGELPKQHAD